MLIIVICNYFIIRSENFSYAYRVLITPAGEAAKIVDGRKGTYTKIANFHGIDIHVFRINRSESSEGAESRNKLNKEKGILEVLR